MPNQGQEGPDGSTLQVLNRTSLDRVMIQAWPVSLLPTLCPSDIRPNRVRAPSCFIRARRRS